MFLLEIIAILTTLICVMMTYKENILCWPFGIVGLISYFFIFQDKGLIVEATLQIVFISQSLYGWYNWGGEDKLEISRTTLNKFLFDIVDFFVGTLILYYSFEIQFLDAFTALYSILATKYLVQKKLQAWVVWIVVDLFMIILFINNELYLSAAFYLLLLGMAIHGFMSWRKKLHY